MRPAVRNVKIQNNGDVSTPYNAYYTRLMAPVSGWIQVCTNSRRGFITSVSFTGDRNILMTIPDPPWLRIEPMTVCIPDVY